MSAEKDPNAGKPKPATKPTAGAGRPLADRSTPAGERGVPKSSQSLPSKTPATKPAADAPPLDSGLASLLDEELSSFGEGPSSLSGGPLDALLNDPSLAEAVQETSPLAGPLGSAETAPKSPGWAIWSNRRARKRLWIGLGSAGVAIPVIVAVSIWAATRQDPNEVLRPADAAYQAANYADAVKLYDGFLDRYPSRATSGRARVRRGLARLQLAFAGTSSELGAAATAKNILPAISSDEDFEVEAGPVVAALLPPLAEASAAHVQRRPEAASIAQSEEILALAQQYIPAAEKPRQRLGKVEAILALCPAANRRRRRPEEGCCGDQAGG